MLSPPARFFPFLSSMSDQQQYEWWQEGIIYEVFVRSFQDSNGDGIGDIRGIMERLDYLQWLGVTALWLTPVYPSPMKDFGYDISDCTGIHPLFGTLTDFDDLVAAVHRRGMKLIMDIVPNHTSAEHPWFIESSSSRNNPKRDWYYWKDPKEDGSEPNNWLSVLGGSAWQWHEGTQQYYYHAFLREQPDLNLANPEVFNAILDVMRFWLDRGVDGFRVDVMWHLIKDPLWRDNPVNPYYNDTMPDCEQLEQVFSCDQPEVHDVIRKMRILLDSYDDRMMIGELYLPVDKIVAYYGNGSDGSHLPGNFQLMFVNWQADELALVIDQYEAALPAETWPNWVLSNHDRPRLISRIGAQQAYIAALLLLTLRGTPIMYYGDEIGMDNVPIPDNEVQDPQGLLMPGKNLSRDPQRTPMQWSSSANAGFTKAKPWLRLADNYREVNVADEQENAGSLLLFYKRLIALRQQEAALRIGDYIPVVGDKQLLAYIRRHPHGADHLVVANLTGQPATFDPKHMTIAGTIVLATEAGMEGKALHPPLQVAGNAGMIVKLAPGNK